MHCRAHYNDGSLQWGIYEYDVDFASLALLCDSSQAEYAVKNFKSEKRRCEWLAVRAALRILSGCDADVAYTPEGKPLRVDGKGHISISHSGCYVAVALHRDCDVGIDVELRSSRVSAVRGRVLSAVEEDALDRENEAEALLLHWSAKETMFKLMDDVAVDFIKHLRILPFKPEESGMFEAREYRSDEKRKFRSHYDTHPHYVLTFARLE